MWCFQFIIILWTCNISAKMICVVSELGHTLGSETVSMHCLSALWVTLWHTTGLLCFCCGRWEEPLFFVYDSLRAVVVVMSPCWKYANCLCVLVLCSSAWQVTMVPSVALLEQSLSVSDGPAQSPCAQTVHPLCGNPRYQEKREIHASCRQRHFCTQSHLYTYPLNTCLFMCKQIGSMINKHKHCPACIE